MHEFAVEEITIFMSGVSSGRDAAARAFGTAGFKIAQIKDKTPVPHNGCRPKKPRRV
ncbi:MAG: 30S ribosomal protein S11 [candidate division WS2 bacterium ADurb.Bin280]|uniref:30S ribosomal protein S11 n=1 Tax=candidate division WS2 bacterium ADurb.Bin280 TaxID=1852829 RepID=A0A1V5SCE0_9BACT|nr:MAG: 30S ribosomal protein S11 [candidate division WS2 bacterium ADurb.Bin280]